MVLYIVVCQGVLLRFDVLIRLECTLYFVNHLKIYMFCDIDLRTKIEDTSFTDWSSSEVTKTRRMKMPIFIVTRLK